MKKFLKPSIILTGIAISALAAFFACDKSDTPEADNIPNLRSLSAEEKKVVDASNDFSLDVFAKVNAQHESENIFISPFSISTALSMTLNGASGETLMALKEGLALGQMDDEEINQAYKDLVGFLLDLDKKVTLQVANSNWYKEELTIRQEFKSVLQEFYDAEINAADFSDPQTKDRINQWIENKTSGKIKDMLDGIPGDAVMYLINAVYFNAEWQYQFEKNKTEDRTFHLADGGTTKVPTMFSKGTVVNYSYKNGVQFIDIPYGNGQFYFSVLMPDDVGAVNTLIEHLSPQQVDSFLEDTTTYSTELYLPKIKIEFKKLLNEVLIEMGMGKAFSDNADFSRLFAESLSLAISRVMHQSFLEVNEEGTEAAAATIVEIRELSAGGEGKPPVITVDKPFAFFIREKHSNTLLFAGKVLHPN